MSRYLLAFVFFLCAGVFASSTSRSFSQSEISDIHLGVGTLTTEELEQLLSQQEFENSAALAAELKDYFKDIVAQTKKISELRRHFYNHFNCQMTFPFDDTSIRPGLLTYVPTTEGTSLHFMRQMVSVPSLFEMERAWVVESFLDHLGIGAISRDEMREAFLSKRNARELATWLFREAPAIDKDRIVQIVLEFSAHLTESTVASFFLSELPPDLSTKLWPTPREWAEVYFPELKRATFNYPNWQDSQLKIFEADLKKIHLEILRLKEMRRAARFDDEIKEKLALVFKRSQRAASSVNCETWSLGLQ